MQDDGSSVSLQYDVAHLTPLNVVSTLLPMMAPDTDGWSATTILWGMFTTVWPTFFGISTFTTICCCGMAANASRGMVLRFSASMNSTP